VTSTPPPGDEASAAPWRAAPAPPPAGPPAQQPPAPPEGQAPARRGQPGWRPWTAWAAFLAGFGATIFGGLFVAIIASTMGGDIDDPSPGINIGLTFFQNASLIGAALLFAHMAGPPRGRDFGLRRTDPGRAFGLLLAVWFSFYAFSALWVLALSLDEKQTLPDELGAGGSTVNLILVIVLITMIAPLGEELFFRGYFFASLRNWKGFWPAAVITGLVFGAIHIGSAPIGFTVPLGFFGFGLCLLYQHTGSLYPCIALHALNNAVALGLTQKWSAAEIAPLMLAAPVAALALARLLAQLLDGRASRLAPPLAQPAA
jgi:membrane protease YdiL (CAAX protease family)